MANMSAERINENRNDRQIYLIKTQIYSYYVIIPVMSQSVSMLLGLVDNMNNDKVKEIPFLENNAVVIPNLNEQMVGYLRAYQDNYDQAVDYFRGLMSNSMGLLKHNGKMLEPIILINNNEQFGNFINYFVGKFSGSVRKIDNDLLARKMSSNSMPDGLNNQVSMASDIPVNPMAYPNYQIENDLEQDKAKTRVKKKDNRGEPGFVSYVLLGVVIAILSLVFLYMLI